MLCDDLGKPILWKPILWKRWAMKHPLLEMDSGILTHHVPKNRCLNHPISTHLLCHTSKNPKFPLIFPAFSILSLWTCHGLVRVAGITSTPSCRRPSSVSGHGDLWLALRVRSSPARRGPGPKVASRRAWWAGFPLSRSSLTMAMAMGHDSGTTIGSTYQSCHFAAYVFGKVGTPGTGTHWRCMAMTQEPQLVISIPFYTIFKAYVFGKTLHGTVPHLKILKFHEIPIDWLFMVNNSFL